MATTPSMNRELHHALILPNDAVGADVGQMVEYAVAAEEAGWDGVFLWDALVYPTPSSQEGAAGDPTPGWNPPEYDNCIDPLITLAGIATRTDRIALGTWIIPIPRRQPWQVAKDLATLDRLSNGRVILGAGLGRRPDYEKFGETWDAKTMGQKYDEALEIIAGLWSGERFSFKGKHYSVDDVALLPTPMQQPRIPILIAGFWPNKRPFQRGARWDGIMPFFFSGGDQPSPEATVREMLGYYYSLSDDPGDVFLPINPPGASPEYVDVCKELGVNWLYSYPIRGASDPGENLKRIADGPPR